MITLRETINRLPLFQEVKVCNAESNDCVLTEGCKFDLLTHLPQDLLGAGVAMIKPELDYSKDGEAAIVLALCVEVRSNYVLR